MRVLGKHGKRQRIEAKLSLWALKGGYRGRISGSIQIF
jgi:hypothetical protein